MRRSLVIVAIAGLLAACGASATPTREPTAETGAPDIYPVAVAPPYALVTDVFVTGTPGAYSFAVTVSSPDTGCDSYVDWWEVVTPDGSLVYRHTLLHSHVDEQPFTRAGGPITIGEGDEVIVRAHMNSIGYGLNGLRMRATGRQTPVELTPDFAAALESVAPQAPACAF